MASAAHLCPPLSGARNLAGRAYRAASRAVGALFRHGDEAARAAGGGGGSLRRFLADTDVLVNAAEQAHRPLGASALAHIRGNRVLITPNQLREFLHFPGITGAQRRARRAFLEREGIQLFGGHSARAAAGTRAFQEAFQALRRGQGRGDAALVAFARELNMPAYTANSALIRYIRNTLGASPARRALADDLLRVLFNIR